MPRRLTAAYAHAAEPDELDLPPLDADNPTPAAFKAMLSGRAAPGAPGASISRTTLLDDANVKAELVVETKAIPPPPPIDPELTALILMPATVLAGGSVWGTVSLNPFRSSTAAVNVAISSDLPNVIVPALVTVPMGSNEANFPVGTSTAITADLTAIIKATLGMKSLTATLKVTAKPLPPPPPGPLDVKTAGLKGDGTTDDGPALQKLLDERPEGQVLTFPPGEYRIGNQVYVKKAMTLKGTKGATWLKHIDKRCLIVGTPEATIRGAVLDGMGFLGQPGRFMDGGNWTHALIDHGTGTLIKNCVVKGSGNGFYSVFPGSGMTVEDCEAEGWGSVMIGAFVGTTVKRCRFVQNDPFTGEPQHSSHGGYLHTGSRNVLFEDVTFVNVRKYGVQIYGESVGKTIEDTVLRRVTFDGCNSGITIVGFPKDASRAKRVLLDSCKFLRTAGVAVSLKSGDDITMTDCEIDRARDGLVLGGWASWEADMGSLVRARISGTKISNCSQRGLVVTKGAGGLFSECVVEGTVYGPGNVRNYYADEPPAAGVVVR